MTSTRGQGDGNQVHPGHIETNFSKIVKSKVKVDIVCLKINKLGRKFFLIAKVIFAS